MGELKGDKEQIKKKLFEVMEKIAGLPPKDGLDEYEELNTHRVTADVKNLKKLTSPAQTKAASRINSQREFNEAFEMWFDSLGFHDENKKKKINISTTISHMSDFLEKKGIKY